MVKDPQRLLFDDEASPLARSLVASWESERPSPEGRAKALAALGVAAVVTTAASTASAGAGASIAPKAVLAVAWTKWALLGLGVAGIVVGAAVVWRGRPSAPLPPEVSVERAAPPPVERPVASAAPVAPSASGVLISEAPTPPTLAPKITSSGPSAHPASASLAEQLAALDAARAVLDQGDPGKAQALVDDYESRYRNGAFVQEAEVLRIQALLRRGDRAGAERVASRFFAAYPKSPHAARVRSLLSLPAADR